MPWLQLFCETARENAERLADRLEGAGALSVTFGDAGDEPQLEPGPGETPLWSRVTLAALFDSDPASADLVERLARELAPALAAPPRIDRIEDQVWERVWLQDFRPTRFGRRLWVCPHGQMPEDPAGRVVWLDPGLAFGTGHHATTALCLEWLDGADLDGRIVLDYGCGSGILAIAALKLGAARALGVDHDPQALEATRDNAAANGVAAALSIQSAEELLPASVDVLVANILAGPLIELAPRLSELLRPGGALALSGILEDQVERVRAAYADLIGFAPTRVRDGWALLAGTRRALP